VELPADRRVLVAFSLVVLLGGTNVVLVVVTTRELEPFWSAGLRFSAASAIGFAVVRALGLHLPRGRDLGLSVLYGVFSFALGFGLFYWGTQRVSAGVASVIMGAVPLLTFLLALLQRIERFRLRGLAGACLAIAGIGVISSSRAGGGSFPILSLLAVVGAAASAGQSAILARRVRLVHPLMLNAIGMGIGAALLLTLSVSAGEARELPASGGARAALLVLIVSSPPLFVLFVFVVQRWSASAASYQFVLFPLVSIVLGAALLGESISATLLAGAPLVLLGVYVGALSSGGRPAEHESAPPAR
jgi:drug/metabolite transporter (DMT)-like permease